MANFFIRLFVIHIVYTTIHRCSEERRLDLGSSTMPIFVDFVPNEMIC